MSTLSLLLAATMVLAPTAATAPPDKDNPEDADEAAHVGTEAGTSVYEFADDKLTGEHLTPDGVMIPWRRPKKHPSLINLRGHFLPELVTLALDV